MDKDNPREYVTATKALLRSMYHTLNFPHGSFNKSRYYASVSELEKISTLINDSWLHHRYASSEVRKFLKTIFTSYLSEDAPDLTVLEKTKVAPEEEEHASKAKEVVRQAFKTMYDSALTYLQLQYCLYKANQVAFRMGFGPLSVKFEGAIEPRKDALFHGRDGLRKLCSYYDEPFAGTDDTQ